MVDVPRTQVLGCSYSDFLRVGGGVVSWRNGWRSAGWMRSAKGAECRGTPTVCGSPSSAHGGEVVALSGRCPHANGPLGLGWIEEGEVVCPLHRLAVPAG